MIGNMNELIGALAQTTQHLTFEKSAVTTKGSGTLHSLWQASGEPGVGVKAATELGENVTNATVGAIYPLNSPATNKTLYLARATLAASTKGHYFLYQRVFHCAGIEGNTTASQSLNSGSYFTGEGTGLRAFVEWYTTTGTGTPTLTLTYHNDIGVSQTAAVVLPDSPVAGQMVRIPLASGDKGIRQLISVQLSGATSAAGEIGITIAKPLVDFPINANLDPRVYDAIGLGLPPLWGTTPALAWMFLASHVSHGDISGTITVVEG